MAEVVSISGAALGATACPTGWQVTPNGNCGAPSQGCAPNMKVGNACRDPRALALQTALVSMGRTIKDSALSSLAIDGFIGPKTTAAVNRAFTTHIGSGQAPAVFRTGKLQIDQVAEQATTLTDLVKAEVQRRGGVLAPIPAQPLPQVVPQQVVQAEALRPRPSNALWALVGLNAVAAGTGFWFAWKGSRGGAAVAPRTTSSRSLSSLSSRKRASVAAYA